MSRKKPSIHFSLILIFIQCASSRFIIEMETSNDSYARPTFEKYEEMRRDLMEKHLSRALGSNVRLNENEEKLNEIIMGMKMEELARGFQNPFNFTPARHFFEVKKTVESSPLFKIIRKMPKGGILHAHDTAICSTDYVISLTKWEHLWQWGSIDDGNVLPKFLFSRHKPDKIEEIEWRLVSDIRQEIGNDVYDKKIRRFFTMIVDDPIVSYNDVNAAWDKFMNLFIVFGSIVEYKEAWRNYYKQALHELYDDNVQYLELRSVFPELYDLDGNKYGPDEVAKIYVEVLKDFKNSHPDFAGGKFIYAPVRGINDETFNTYLPIMRKLKNKFPNYIAGFDLVGQEDKGRPLNEYAERLLKFPEDIQFFFHAAETNWLGTSSDENIIDAVILGTKRIGHGYGVVKYPHLLKVIKEKKIGIEINPISNQVLKLVDDFRNHPAAILFADDYPVVISSDDPSFWGAYPLTHDFYFAFLGIASAQQDLRALKRLILNSFEFSALSNEEKLQAKTIWLEKWNKFIKDCLHEYKHVSIAQI